MVPSMPTPLNLLAEGADREELGLSLSLEGTTKLPWESTAGASCDVFGSLCRVPILGVKLGDLDDALRILDLPGGECRSECGVEKPNLGGVSSTSLVLLDCRMRPVFGDLRSSSFLLLLMIRGSFRGEDIADLSFALKKSCDSLRLLLTSGDEVRLKGGVGSAR